jgi:imidazolonepropionase-like amidohydrolase
MKQLQHIASAILTLSMAALSVACSPEDQTQRQSAVTEAAPAPVTSTVSRADLVIQGGVLLDMVADDPDPTPIKGLVIRDGKIDRIIAADSSESLPASATTINADSNYILPGLIDAHVHFRPWLSDASIWKRASIYYGVTTLFDTGPCGDTCVETGQEANEWIKAYKEFMNSSAAPDGPSLYMTGRRIQDPDGAHPLGEKLSNRNEIARYMDSLVELGVDGFKVESSLPADLRGIVIEEANARGLPVVGHSRDANESIAAGMKFIEHMWPITSSIAAGDPGENFSSPLHDHLMDLDKAPELIQSIVNNGVYVNPTMLGRYGYFADSMKGEAAIDVQSLAFGGLYSDMPEHYKAGVNAWWARAGDWDADRLEKHNEGLAKVERFLKLLSEAGGRVLAATDSGADKMVGISLHREMKMLADAGITPYRVLLGATRWPAEMTYKDASIGTIAEGKHADIAIFGSNPAMDINNSRDIRYVIKSGAILRSPADCSVIIPPISISCAN